MCAASGMFGITLKFHGLECQLTDSSHFRLFFVIECVNGGDLMYHMQRHRRLPEEHARFYSAEISLALNYLHNKGQCTSVHACRELTVSRVFAILSCVVCFVAVQESSIVI